MNLSLNLNLSAVVKPGMSASDLDQIGNSLESLVARFQAKYGALPVSVSPVASGDILARNRAYLSANDTSKTPRLLTNEIGLRAKCEAISGNVDWNDIQVRREALLPFAYDIFNPQRDNPNAKSSNDTVAGETFHDEVSSDIVPE